jgi:hypothetical protein
MCCGLYLRWRLRAWFSPLLLELPKLHQSPRSRWYHGRTWRCNAGFVASMLARSLGAPALLSVLARPLGPSTLQVISAS